METRHGAIIEIDFKLLAEFLHFKGGIIHRVYTPENYMFPDKCCVIIEHPDLPEVPLGEELSTITPILESTYDKYGNLVSIKRIYPITQDTSEVSEN